MTWTPDPQVAARSRLAEFARFVAEEYDGPPDPLDYEALWAWSVTDLGRFWGALWTWFEPPSEGDASVVLADASMPGAQWFPDVALNYAEVVLAHADREPDGVAVTGTGEGVPDVTLTWTELRDQVLGLAATLRSWGVGPGDRVAGYVPHIPQAIVAFLATASLGAVWTAVGQDYAPTAVLDRFAPLAPVVLVAADGYRYAGRTHDKRDAVAAVRAGLPSLRHVVGVDRAGLDLAGTVPDAVAWERAVAGPADATGAPPLRVGFAHPLWVLFSSGTTGAPKGIVHGHGGVVAEYLKVAGLHLDLGPGTRLLWFTSPSWMMWNYQVSALLVGAGVVCHDGDPTAAEYDALWALTERLRVDVLGTSPGFLAGCERADRHPGAEHDLSGLRVLGVTGSVLPAHGFDWVTDEVGAHVQVGSTTGGTDVVTGFAGPAPTTPVRRGEIAARCLGVAMQSWDPDGRPLVGEVGELVVTAPMPSMPVSFWDDPTGAKYHAAYFEHYPGVWRHGDWVTVTDRGSVVVHGRSDATLNRGGVRMGSSDLYAVIEAHPAVAEALVVGVEQPDGAYWMPLFVVASPGHAITDAVKEELRAALRSRLSPRHVPDQITEVPGLPHTRTGKKLEIPVKRLLQGASYQDIANPGSIDDPAHLQQFERYVPAPPSR